jgi:hypothetical protein
VHVEQHFVGGAAWTPLHMQALQQFHGHDRMGSSSKDALVHIMARIQRLQAPLSTTGLWRDCSDTGSALTHCRLPQASLEWGASQLCLLLQYWQAGRLPEGRIMRPHALHSSSCIAVHALHALHTRAFGRRCAGRALPLASSAG